MALQNLTSAPIFVKVASRRAASGTSAAGNNGLTKESNDFLNNLAKTSPGAGK